MIGLLAGLSIAGCSGGASSTDASQRPAADAAADASDEPTSYTVRGIYVGPVFDGQAMRVDHEAIPGFMEAMTMDLEMAAPNVIDGIEPGDKIQFTLKVREYDIVVESAETLPPDTELELEAKDGAH